MDEEKSTFELLQEAQADIVYQQHNGIIDGSIKEEHVNNACKNVNEGIKNLCEMQNVIQRGEDAEAKAEKDQKELDIKRDELEFKKQQAEKEFTLKEQELDFKKDQADEDNSIRRDELEFKKQQAAEEKKARVIDILVKLGIAAIPVIISCVFAVILTKITCKENRDTLMTTLFANEILERNGEISGLNVKDVTKEALRKAMDNKIIK